MSNYESRLIDILPDRKGNEQILISKHYTDPNRIVVYNRSTGKTYSNPDEFPNRRKNPKVILEKFLASLRESVGFGKVKLYQTKEEVEQQLRNAKVREISTMTNSCNMKCGYCRLNPQNYDSGTVTFDGRMTHPDDMKSFAEYLKKNNLVSEGLYKKAWGGEPTIATRKFIEDNELFIELFGNYSPRFAVTSNFLDVPDELMEHWKSYNFQILASYDGPFQNMHRVDKRGKGTDEKVLSSLTKLFNKYPDYFKKNLSLNIVLDLVRIGENGLRKMVNFFENDSSLNSEMLQSIRNIFCTTVYGGNIRNPNLNVTNNDILSYYKQRRELRIELLDKIRSGDKISPILRALTGSMFSTQLIEPEEIPGIDEEAKGISGSCYLVDRPLIKPRDEPKEPAKLTGCIQDTTFLTIGNARDGFDYTNLASYLSEFTRRRQDEHSKKIDVKLRSSCPYEINSVRAQFAFTPNDAFAEDISFSRALDEAIYERKRLEND